MPSFKIRTTLTVEYESVVEDMNVQAAMEMSRVEAQRNGEVVCCTQDVSLAEEEKGTDYCSICNGPCLAPTYISEVPIAPV